MPTEQSTLKEATPSIPPQGAGRPAVCVSLDVEEEGLFRGAYRVLDPPVSNIARLERLVPLLDMGVRPTLFCAHSVLADGRAWDRVEALAARYPLEIGAHLHHWNTPPLEGPQAPRSRVPSAEVADDLLAAKLETLLELARRRTGSRPTSFRMGRWDLHARHWPILARAGVLADASVRPLHRGNARNLGPDHYRAPAAPYVVEAAGRAVFELPLTVTSLSPAAARLLPSLGEGVASSFQHWGALALLPVHHPLWAMKAVTRLALARGAGAVSLTWHSSELMPGGNPALPDEAAVDAMLSKIARYLAWLADARRARFATLDELRRSFPARPAHADAGDWTYRENA